MKQYIGIILAVFIGFTESLYGQVTLTGQIEALGNGTLVIKYYEGDSEKTDEVKINNGKFIWQAAVTESQKITMVFPGRATWIFIEPGKMVLKGSRDSLHNLQLTNSRTNDEALIYNKLTSSLSPEQRKAFEENYISAHRSSVLSLSLITDRCRLGDYEEVSKMYNQLAKNLRSTAEGRRIFERLKVLKHSSLGEKMLDFTINDHFGKPVSFSSFKGKYVLIDFWASWCVPCRKEVPNLIQAFNTFEKKNFTIVGISLDDNNDRWQKAIKDLRMPWIQLSDLKDWDTELVHHYGIRGIPYTLLIDPSGRIIAKNLRGEKLNQKLMELFN